MILNTGMRTDIPAYFPLWFANRLDAGYVLVRNPYNPLQVTRYRLDPRVVDILCFGSKNPAPILPYLDKIKKFRTFWFVTMNPYGRELEPNVPPWQEVAQTIRVLAGTFGKRAVCWRVSPVIVNDTYSVQWHAERFAEMARALAGTVETCMIAFLDLYDKTRRNFPAGRRVTGPEKAQIAQAFLQICQENDIRLIGCYEDQDLAQYGVDVSGCMTHHALEHAGDIRLTIPKGERSVQKSPGTSAAITQAQRRDHLEHGGCILGNDIGAYNTCPHGCKYCYANYDQAAVAANCRRHDPASPYLVGGPIEGEVIHQARQVSWIDRQLSLF